MLVNYKRYFAQNPAAWTCAAVHLYRLRRSQRTTIHIFLVMDYDGDHYYALGPTG